MCKDVMYEIEKEYPLNYALSWDNVGLLRFLLLSFSFTMMLRLWLMQLHLAKLICRSQDLPPASSVVYFGNKKSRRSIERMPAFLYLSY